MSLVKQLVNHHAGNILIESEDSGRFLCNIYDNTHPIELFRGRLNFLGGGKNSEDISPIMTVQRELYEEFLISKNKELDPATVQDSGKKYLLPKINKMASLEDIEKVKKGIFENIIPYQDFLITIKQIDKGPKLQNPNALFSTFYSKISKNLFDIIKRNIEINCSLVNDSFLRIVTTEELIEGNPLTSWACGRVFEYYLNKKIPNPENTIAKPLGEPKKTYSQYLDEFDYIRF
jgi:hypothetical protein